MAKEHKLVVGNHPELKGGDIGVLLSTRHALHAKPIFSSLIRFSEYHYQAYAFLVRSSATAPAPAQTLRIVKSPEWVVGGSSVAVTVNGSTVCATFLIGPAYKPH